MWQLLLPQWSHACPCSPGLCCAMALSATPKGNDSLQYAILCYTLHITQKANSMPTLPHTEFLRRHPAFTTRELRDYLVAQGATSPRAAESLLASYTRRGRVWRVRRGLYYVPPAPVPLHGIPLNPYAVAAKITPDAVLSHHTALEFHGCGHSVWYTIQYTAARPVPPVAFTPCEIAGTRTPAALLQAQAADFGVVEGKMGAAAVQVTGPARTMVDVLDRPDLAGGWEEIWLSLEHLSAVDLDLDETVAYALLRNTPRLCAKVGFYLEQHRDPLGVTDIQLDALRARRPTRPLRMDPQRRPYPDDPPDRLVSTWNLLVPDEVLDRPWDRLWLAPEMWEAEI